MLSLIGFGILFFYYLNAFNIFLLTNVLGPMKQAYLNMPVVSTFVLFMGAGYIIGGIRFVYCKSDTKVLDILDTYQVFNIVVPSHLKLALLPSFTFASKTHQ